MFYVQYITYYVLCNVYCVQYMAECVSFSLAQRHAGVSVRARVRAGVCVCVRAPAWVPLCVI
jgi:hypothetical protein